MGQNPVVLLHPPRDLIPCSVSGSFFFPGLSLLLEETVSVVIDVSFTPDSVTVIHVHQDHKRFHTRGRKIEEDLLLYIIRFFSTSPVFQTFCDIISFSLSNGVMSRRVPTIVRRHLTFKDTCSYHTSKDI